MRVTPACDPHDIYSSAVRTAGKWTRKHEHDTPSSNLPLRRRKLNEPGEQEAKAAAMAVARAVDSAIQMLRPGTRITGRHPPPALLAVRFGVHDILIVRGVGGGGNGPAT